jgi:uncharacterized protein
MVIKNKTNNQILAKNHHIYSNIFSKARGLMFSKQKNLIFPFDKEKLVPLHMYFVFFPIDVIFLNKNNKIVETKENFKPFSYYSPKCKAKFVIELKNGIIAKTNTKIGDYLTY